MSTTVHVIARARVKPGMEDTAREAIQELTDFCRASEPALQTYEFYLDESGKELVAIETYRDADGVLAHNTDGHNERFFQAVEITGVEFFGPVTDELMRTWRGWGLNPVLHQRVGGFAR